MFVRMLVGGIRREFEYVSAAVGDRIGAAVGDSVRADVGDVVLILSQFCVGTMYLSSCPNSFPILCWNNGVIELSQLTALVVLG